MILIILCGILVSVEIFYAEAMRQFGEGATS